MRRLLSLTLLSAVLLSHVHSMIMRNNALMSKMVSQFQGKDKHHREEEEPPEQTTNASPQHVITLMQNVLCKNFPSIPCGFITKDDALRHLIERSIRQIKYKKMTIEKSTPAPSYQLTLFPIMNSEELSNFLQVTEKEPFHSKKPKKKKHISTTEKTAWPHERKFKPYSKKGGNNKKSALFNSRKKMRKFYPHKIKYKDKHEKKEYAQYSEEKLSMSVETPDAAAEPVRRKHFEYRGEPDDPPVWRIDYTKHGEPSFNLFSYPNDNLKTKLVKTGPNVIVDDQAARKDVMHPDVYIKNSYVRKNTLDKSGGIEYV